MNAVRNIVRSSVAGLLVAGAVGIFGGHAVHAAQPVTFEVAGGVLALNQTPTAGTALVQNTAVAMPVTTITDGNAAFNRSGAWTVTATVTALTGSGTALGASIAASQMTLDETGSFTTGTGTRVDEAAVVATGTLVSATGDSINSVYTYTPTVKLATQTLPFSGSYAGTVTQTVV